MSQGFTKDLPLDNDPTLAANSQQMGVTEYAVKTYVDNIIKKGAFGFNIVGIDTIIIVGLKSCVVAPPFAGTITGWDLFEVTSTPIASTCVIDIWKDTYANYPPTVADTIFGTKPSLSAATKNQATGLSIPFSAGDVFVINVDSNDLAKNLYFGLTVIKT